MTFSRFPKERQQALIDYLMQRHRWDESRAKAELEAMDEIGLAYVNVEAKLARRKEVVYDPCAEMWKVT